MHGPADANQGGGAFLRWQRSHAMPPGTPCPNCATPALGPWCHVCGQTAHDFHRSALHLATEAFESFFHADGRLWRTLVRLASNPARLTRDFLAGKRAPQIPPLRLFLVVLLLLFLIGSWNTRNIDLIHFDGHQSEIETQIRSSQVHIGLSPAWDAAASAWIRDHLGLAVAHPDLLLSAMRERAENVAFLMLPISAVLLAVIFAFQRRFVLFDHLVFSMHSLSFQGLLIIAMLLGQSVVGDGASILLYAAPLHLFFHMRGVYGTGGGHAAAHGRAVRRQHRGFRPAAGRPGAGQPGHAARRMKPATALIRDFCVYSSEKKADRGVLRRPARSPILNQTSPVTLCEPAERCFSNFRRS